MRGPLVVLAFGWAVPFLLWGTVLAAVPLLIHLLYRRKHRDVRWAAMQFLIAATQKQSRTFRLDQWLLLLLRMLIPIAAAIALAGPMLSAPTTRDGKTPRVQRLLLVDASLSVAAGANGPTRLETLRAQAETLLDQGQPGDLWQLVRIAGAAPYALIAEPARQADPVRDELRALATTEESGDLLAALRTSASLLSMNAPAELREVHVFTDAQRTAWRPADPAQRTELHAAWKEIAQKARILWHDVGEAPVANAAVTDLVPSATPAFPQQTVRVTATVRLFGGSAPQPRTLQWYVDDRLSGAETLELTPGEAVTREFTVTATTPAVRIEARLSADALAADDRRYLVVPVLATLPVLLVDGRPSPQPFESASAFVQLALAPLANTAMGNGGIAPKVIADGELVSTDLTPYAAVFLCDVPRLTDRDADVLRRYVGQGGALVIGLGPGVRAENYNGVLHRSDQDLLPSRLGEIVGDAARRETQYLFEGGDFSHPMLQPFRGNPNTGFELAQSFAYYRTKFPEDRGGAVIRFDSGDPAVLDIPWEEGRVLLITTSLDRSWSAWPLWGHSFVPMMQELLRSLATERAAGRNLPVGKPLLARLPLREGEQATVRKAGATEVVATVRAGGEHHRVQWDAPRQAGFYALESPSTGGASVPPQWFAVNVDPRESDLAPLSPTELREELLRGLDVDFAGTVEAPATAAPAPESAALGARWFGALLLIFLLTEPFLAWQREAGLLALIGLVAIGSLGSVWGPVGVLLGAALVGVALGGRRLLRGGPAPEAR